VIHRQVQFSKLRSHRFDEHLSRGELGVGARSTALSLGQGVGDGGVGGLAGEVGVVQVGCTLTSCKKY
jgi:hypothetical protein